MAREGEDNEVAEENFWEEMDKMCREENYFGNFQQPTNEIYLQECCGRQLEEVHE